MRKLIKFFLQILKDEAGIDPVTLALIGGGLMAGGGLMSAFGGEDEDIYDPYAQERQKYTGYLSGKLGTYKPYRYNPAFEIPKPAIETQTENLISGRLGNLPKTEDYRAKVEASKTQQIAREKERAGVQQEEEKNMYNRLGLVSSTPWMTRAGELGEESLGRQRDIESGMDIFGLNYGLASDKLVEDIINQRTTQGQVLGQAQRGYNQYPIGMSFADIQRQTEEEEYWANLMQSYLLRQPAERTLTPDFLSQMGGTLTNIGSLGMMGGINALGRK